MKRNSGSWHSTEPRADTLTTTAEITEFVRQQPEETTAVSTITAPVKETKKSSSVTTQETTAATGPVKGVTLLTASNTEVLSTTAEVINFSVAVVRLSYLQKS